MIERIATFVASLLAAFAIAIVSIWFGEGPKPLVWVVALALLLSAVFSLAVAYVGLYPKFTLAGLVCGALLFTMALAFFDWALGMPPTAQLSATSFGRYMRLLSNPASIIAVATPLLVVVAGFVSGRGLFLLLGGRKPVEPAD